MIVGTGDFPYIFLKKAENLGKEIYPIALFESVNDSIKSHKNFANFSIGEVGGIISHFIKNDIKNVIMLGKVDKSLIFTDIKKDKIYNLVMDKMPNNKDETLLMAVVGLLKLNGIKILPQNYLLEDFMAKDEIYTNVQPTLEDKKTIDIGIEACKALTKLDISQTSVVKDGSVIALEGIDGTDKTLERAYNCVGDGCIIVKLARPKQDLRLDIPVIGLNTIKKAVEIKAKGIIIEADKMIFLQKDEVIAMANKNNIFIKAIRY